MARAGAAQAAADDDGDDGQQAEPTLREQLESARDESVARQEREAAGEPIADEVREPRRRDAAADGERGSRARDTSGRFAPSPGNQRQGAAGDGVVDPQAPAGGNAQDGARGDPQGGQQPTGGTPAAAGAAPASGLEQPPQGWTQAERGLWKDLTPQVRNTILRREADFHKKLTQHDEVRNIGNEFVRTSAEYAQIVQATGMTPVALYKQYLDTIRTIRTADPITKARMFGELAGRNGIDLRLLFANGGQQPGNGPAPQPGAAPQGGAPAVHPMVLQLHQQVQQLTRAQQEAAERQTREQEEARERVMAETQSEIEVFRSTPGHEHFEEVHPYMAALLQQGLATGLQDAYDQATRAHPTVSARIAQAAAAAAQAGARQRQQVQRARARSGSVASGPGGHVPQTGSKGSVRADLEAAREEIMGRI